MKIDGKTMQCTQFSHQFSIDVIATYIIRRMINAAARDGLIMIGIDAI